MKVEFSEIVDLSHEISEKMPVWPGDPKTEIFEIEYEGYMVEKLTIGTHTGTHIGTPRHFGFSGNVTDLKPKDLFVKAVLVDVSCDRHDLDVEEIEKWQRTHRKITEECVILKTGQDVFWNDGERYFKEYPGFTADAVEYLFEVGVRIFATDAPSVDPSCDKLFLSNLKIFEKGGIHVENLTNLQKLPLYDFWIFIAPLSLKSGGTPARVVALV